MKPIVKIVFGLLLIAIAVLAMFLLPPHLQVRAIEPALPGAEQLLSLTQLPGGPSRVSYVTTSEQSTDSGLLAHNSVIVEWPDGDLFVIDVGMDRSGSQDFGEIMKIMGAQEGPVFHHTLAEALAEKIHKVSGVGFTHLHIDHTQGLVDFCHNRGKGALLLQSEYQRDEHNFNTVEGASLVADSCLVEESLMDESGWLTSPRYPGLAIVPLGGHTPGSTLFAVADENRVLLFSGDTTNSKQDIIQDRGKGFIYSYLMVPEYTQRTAQLRHWLRALDGNDRIEVLVSHDLESFASVIEAN